MLVIFWLSLLLIAFTYFGYPLVLKLWGQGKQGDSLPIPADDALPSVTILIPAYNEQAVLETKIQNTLQIDYPKDKLAIFVISDGSTDNTNQIAEEMAKQGQITFIPVLERKGKANALNVGLAQARSDIIVFSDSSIMLQPDSIKQIVRRFSDPKIGCISGEDHIPDDEGGEGLYGQYELFLRNQESQVGSIVGASGSFYAQRRLVCSEFIEGLAPDFLSVLNTVEQGYRAVTEPNWDDASDP